MCVRLESLTYVVCLPGKPLAALHNIAGFALFVEVDEQLAGSQLFHHSDNPCVDGRVIGAVARYEFLHDGVERRLGERIIGDLHSEIISPQELCTVGKHELGLAIAQIRLSAGKRLEDCLCCCFLRLFRCPFEAFAVLFKHALTFRLRLS